MLLVGHSYGGAVISVAAAAAENVVGLVYVAAFVLDENESFGEVAAAFPATPLVEALRPSTYPLADGGTGTELTIAPELYRSSFAADLPEESTEILAVMQRPFAAIFDERAQAAGWKALPSWAVVATARRACPPTRSRRPPFLARADAAVLPLHGFDRTSEGPSGAPPRVSCAGA